MSLSELKDSIKSIAALEKATRAMRALSISLHSSLKRNLDYVKKCIHIIHSIQSLNRNNNNNNKINNTNTLYIIIGSQRGLCGQFNKDMIYHFNDIKYKKKNNDIILVVGKKICSMVSTTNDKSIFFVPLLKKNTINEIISIIDKYIYEYNIYSIVALYTHAPTLFSKQISIEHFSDNNTIKDNFDVGHFQKEEINKAIKTIHKNLFLKKIFYESLRAEQAARFIAMDKAWNNSTDIIHEKSITLNKKRQALINRQLEDLSTSKLI
jgi:F-type H+-transporting ATPase subunit gamma